MFFYLFVHSPHYQPLAGTTPFNSFNQLDISSPYQQFALSPVFFEPVFTSPIHSFRQFMGFNSSSVKNYPDSPLPVPFDEVVHS